MDDVAWDEDTDDDDLQEFICISDRVEGNRRDSLRNGVNPLPGPFSLYHYSSSSSSASPSSATTLSPVYPTALLLIPCSSHCVLHIDPYLSESILFSNGPSVYTN